MGILFTILMGFLFTITMGKLFTIAVGIQLTISTSQFEVADDPIDNLVIIYERDVGKVLDIHSFAGEHQEPLFPTVGTPDAGKPAHWIATVQIAL